MDYAYTITGGWKPDEVKLEALASLEYWATTRGDEIDASTLTYQAYDNGDLVFRAKAKLDEDGLYPSLRRARDETAAHRKRLAALMKR